MTKEEKELLLGDLCARLPYGIFVKDGNRNIPVKCDFECHPDLDNLENIKPYLRPMESMTIAERNELADIPNITIYENGETISNGRDIDWMNKRHLDYRGLIPMGLALPATEDMYK